VLEYHPHRSLAHLRGKPARSRHDPILSRNGASDKPGAVQGTPSLSKGTPVLKELT
jgi:hypothetical protein